MSEPMPDPPKITLPHAREKLYTAHRRLAEEINAMPEWMHEAVSASRQASMSEPILAPGTTITVNRHAWGGGTLRVNHDGPCTYNNCTRYLDEITGGEPMPMKPDKHKFICAPIVPLAQADDE